MGIKTLFAQTLADHVPGTDHARPGQFTVVRTELAGVFARDVILIRIVLKDNQIGQGLYERNLSDLLFEAQEKNDAIVKAHVDVLAEIATQVVLLRTGQFPLVAVALLGDPVIQPIKDRSLLFLHQKQNFQLVSLLPASS
ncbi:hypothetical protein D3C87_1397590 [compost metagenome]